MLPAILISQNLVTAPPTSPISVVYEANLRAMSPGGGFAGVRARLPEIAKLKVNTLWLMPIHPVGKARSAGGLGSPYAVQNFDAVNPEFGTRQDFRNLVKDAKKLKIRVILDWVGNHTAWDNPWIQNKDWYTQNENGEITIPAGTNWNDVADLNFGNKTMRAAMIKSMENWVIKEGVDGFRCDYADGIPVDFWQEAISTLRSKAGKTLFFLAEGTRPANISAGFDMDYGWPVYGFTKDLYQGKMTPTDWVTKTLASSRNGLRFITNHDESAWDDSAPNIFGGREAALGAYVITAFSGGSPLIYSGQEIGWESKIPFFERSNLDWNSGKDIQTRYREVMGTFDSAQFATTDVVEHFSTDKVVAFIRTGKKKVVIVLVNTTKEPTSIKLAYKYLIGKSWRIVGNSSTTEVSIPTIGFKPYDNVVLESPIGK
jgi:glycosidase